MRNCSGKKSQLYIYKSNSSTYILFYCDLCFLFFLLLQVFNESHGLKFHFVYCKTEPIFTKYYFCKGLFFQYVAVTDLGTLPHLSRLAASIFFSGQGFYRKKRVLLTKEGLKYLMNQVATFLTLYGISQDENFGISWFVPIFMVDRKDFFH